MTSAELERQFEDIVRGILRSPDNLASPAELRQQVGIAWREFQAADRDHSSTISVDEVQELANRMGLPIDGDADTAMLALDTDLSGVIEPVEFMQWWLERVSLNPNVEKQQEIIAENSFKQFDRDGSGAIDASEFTDLLALIGIPMNESEIEQAIRQLDVDRSGQIDKNEFVTWWTQKATAMRDDQPLARKLRKIADKGRRMFNTDIHTAAFKGNLPLVRQFLEAGTPADLEDQTEFGGGYRVLHYAAYAGHVAICNLLLTHNAGVNKANKEGCTALFLAAQQQHWAVCRLLLDHGADPIHSDPVHRLCVADVCEHDGIMASIRAHPFFTEPTDVPEITTAVINSPHAAIRISVVFAKPIENLTGLPHREWVIRIFHAGDQQPEDTPCTLATAQIPFDRSSDKITVKSEQVAEWFQENMLPKAQRPPSATASKKASPVQVIGRRDGAGEAVKRPTKAQPKSVAKPELAAEEKPLDPDSIQRADADAKDATPLGEASEGNTAEAMDQPPTLTEVPLVVSVAIANAAGVGPWSNSMQLRLVLSKKGASIATASDMASVKSDTISLANSAASRKTSGSRHRAASKSTKR